LIDKTVSRSKWRIKDILNKLGLSRSLYYSWRKREKEKRLSDTKINPYHLFRILPEEEQSVLKYALDHPKDGYWSEPLKTDNQLSVYL
jgi:transposase-like protein